MKLHTVHAEASPTRPSRTHEARRLPDLPGVQDRQKGRVDEQGLWFANEVAQYSAPHGLQETAQLSDPAVQGGRGEAYHPRKEVREEPRSVAQEGPLAFQTPELLEQGEGYDLRIRKLLEALVALSVGVDVLVDVVHQAEQN